MKGTIIMHNEMRQIQGNQLYFDRKTVWQNYVTQGIVVDNMRRDVLVSWQRCQAMNLKPEQHRPVHILSRMEFGRIQQNNHLLIEVSMPILDNVRQYVAGSRFAITLSNADGIILKLTGDDEFISHVHDGGFIEGADWSERSAGTNAIGTALAHRKPIQLCDYEHYCTFTQRTCCSAAPIKGPGGIIVGTVNITCHHLAANSHTLGMAVAMASAVENRLRVSFDEIRNITAEAYKSVFMESIPSGLIAVDANGVIISINRKALNMLSIPHTSVGKNIRELLPGGNDDFYSLISSGESCENYEVKVNTVSGRVCVLSTAQFIKGPQEERFGTVVVLNEFGNSQIDIRNGSNEAKLTFKDVLGRNKKFRKCLDEARRASKSDFTVLLLGESGTGKDVFAQAIHNESNRRNGPFVAINCGAIPKELIASELFGYVSGSFTGARKGGSPGKFELADGGTIFLDEIGEMPKDLQVHLLRVLQDRCVTRIGGQKSIPVDIRVIAATNSNLMEKVEKGTFRLDLYYRLNVISLEIPPLRERKDDLHLFIEQIYRNVSCCASDQSVSIPDDYLRICQNYDWPGNIRELQNAIKRTVALSPNGILDADQLPHEVRAGYGTTSVKPGAIISVERKIIIELMKKNEGNITLVAEHLGIARTTLYRKLEKYQIKKEEYVEL